VRLLLGGKDSPADFFDQFTAGSSSRPFHVMESSRCERLLPLVLYYLMTKRPKN